MPDDPTTAATPPATADDLTARGMRDMGPAEMRRFRRVEQAFLATTARRGFEEIRTPTIEPLHLFTASNALTPQLLDRVYSFLDWDGWSGERVVLRPDGTVPAARWYGQQWTGTEPARLSYVQPVYRFAPGDEGRQRWQGGVELFGAAAPEVDAELLLLARELLTDLALDDLHFAISHAGLMRAVLASTGLNAAEQLAAYDRTLTGDESVVAELSAGGGAGGQALRVLLDVRGSSAAYVANLRPALLPTVPDAAAALDELELITRRLDEAGCRYELHPGTARDFEYYSGLTFRLFAGEQECVSGGRYDGLVAAIGGPDVPAVGFGADLLAIAELLG